MRSLFPELDGAREHSFSDFEKKVSSGNVDWANFYALQNGEREKAVDLLLKRNILSAEREGNFEVIRADSCRQDLAFDYMGKRVYFTNPREVSSFRTYLESRGCVNIAKQR